MTVVSFILCGVCIGRIKAVHKNWMDDNAVVDDKEPPVLVDSGDEEDESDDSEDTAPEDNVSGDDDEQAEAEAAVNVSEPAEQEVELLHQDASHSARAASPSNGKGISQKERSAESSRSQGSETC